MEKDYQKALILELVSEGFSAEKEYSIPMKYKDEFIKNKRIDVLVDKEIIIELKVAEYLTKSAIVQLVSYLKLTNLKLGLVILFNKSGVQVKRVVNEY